MLAGSQGQISVHNVVVLVPGWLDNEDTLAPLGNALRRAGFAVESCSPQPSDGRIPIEELAAQLAEFVAARFGSEQAIDFVGFSMGGLIGRVFLQEMEGWRQIRSFVTLATPHRGSYTAYVASRPALLQMRPGSEFLTRLNRDLTPLGAAHFTSIWTPFDLTIVPPWSSRLPVGRSACVLSPAHAWLPRDPRVQQAVTAALLGAS